MVHISECLPSAGETLRSQISFSIIRSLTATGPDELWPTVRLPKRSRLSKKFALTRAWWIRFD